MKVLARIYVAILVVLAFGIALVPIESIYAVDGCEICADAARCGGNDTGEGLPGWVNAAHCAGKAIGATCSNCAGTASTRNCIAATEPNGKKCNLSSTVCGTKYPNSTCALYTTGGLNIKYCKRAGSSSGSCSIASSCTGVSDV